MSAPWDRRTPDEHQRVAALTLSSWLPAATSFSAYWSHRTTELGAHPDLLTSADDLLRFRPVREDDIRDVGGPGCPALLMRPTQDQVKARGSSSVLMSMANAIRREGGDGERRAILQEYKPIHIHRGGVEDDLAIAYSRSDLDRLHRCGARAASVLGLDDADYLVSAVPSGPRLDWWGVYHLALGASMLALHPRGAGDELDRTIESFGLLPTTVVAVPLDEAAALANLLVEYGEEVPRVHTVLTVGPPPDDATRAEIEEAWRAAGANEDHLVVRALYAPSEARALWAEPRESPTGLVTYPDLEALEVVDALTGEPSEGGGDLTITTAGWHGTALIRYQTGVYVDGIDRTPDASGITAPRIVGGVVPAAWQPDVTRRDGTAGHVDFRAAGDVLSSTEGVQNWRIEVRGPTQKVKHDRVLVEVGGTLDEQDQADLVRRFVAAAGASIHAINVVADPHVLETRIAELGTPFLDAR